MAQYKTVVTQLLTHWNYHSLALSHQFVLESLTDDKSLTLAMAWFLFDIKPSSQPVMTASYGMLPEGPGVWKTGTGKDHARLTPFLAIQDSSDMGHSQALPLKPGLHLHSPHLHFPCSGPEEKSDLTHCGLLASLIWVNTRSVNGLFHYAIWHCQGPMS